MDQTDSDMVDLIVNSLLIPVQKIIDMAQAN